MSEHYTDLFSTTVSNSGSGYTAGSGSLHVASTTGLTASCTVVVMTAALPSTVKALLHVTSVTSGTVLAVTSEGTDNNAVDGDFVYQVLSSRAIDAIKTDILASVPASGALVLLEQHTASSSATLDFTSCITSTYDEYQIEIVNIVPATNSVNLYMRMATDGGSTYDTTSGHYLWEGVSWRAGAGTNVSGSITDGQINITSLNGLTIGNDSKWGVMGSFKYYSPLSTSVYKQLLGQIGNIYTDNTLYINGQVHGEYISLTATNAFRFLMSSGNIASGTIRCYGIAK